MTTGLEHVAKQRRSTQVITPMIACELRGIIIHIHESKLFCCELQGIPWFLTHQHPATIYIYIVIPKMIQVGQSLLRTVI